MLLRLRFDWHACRIIFMLIIASFSHRVYHVRCCLQLKSGLVAHSKSYSVSISSIFGHRGLVKHYIVMVKEYLSNKNGVLMLSSSKNRDLASSNIVDIFRLDQHQGGWQHYFSLIPVLILKIEGQS